MIQFREPFLLQIFCFLYASTFAETLQLETENTIVIKGNQLKVICTIPGTIQNSVVLITPGGSSVTCNPTGIFAASCTPNDGTYAIDEMQSTVTRTKSAESSDEGEWTCTYSSTPIVTTNKNVTVEDLELASSQTDYIFTEMTAQPQSQITDESNDTFSVFYGCFSLQVKFEWELQSTNAKWVTNGIPSSAYTCNIPGTQLYTAKQSASEITSQLASGSSAVKVYAREFNSGTLLNETDPFDVIFIKGQSLTTEEDTSHTELPTTLHVSPNEKPGNGPNRKSEEEEDIIIITCAIVGFLLFLALLIAKFVPTKNNHRDCKRETFEIKDKTGT